MPGARRHPAAASVRGPALPASVVHRDGMAVGIDQHAGNTTPTRLTTTVSHATRRHGIRPGRVMRISINLKPSGRCLFKGRTRRSRPTKPVLSPAIGIDDFRLADAHTGGVDSPRTSYERLRRPCSQSAADAQAGVISVVADLNFRYRPSAFIRSSPSGFRRYG